MASNIKNSPLVYAIKDFLRCSILQTLSSNIMLMNSSKWVTSENALIVDTILSKGENPPYFINYINYSIAFK